MPPASLQALRDEIGRIEGGFGNAAQRRHIATGMAALDARLPGGGMAAGAVHELVGGADGGGLATLAAWLACRAAADGRWVVWFDARGDFYPPPALAWGIPADRLMVVRPKDRRDAYWGIEQSLRCRGVAVVVGAIGQLARSEARRLQLAAESGGGVGLLLCDEAEEAGNSGAASRWQVTPLPSVTDARRFGVNVVRCRGGRPPPPVVVEVDGGADAVALSAELAHRPRSPVVAGVPAA